MSFAGGPASALASEAAEAARAQAQRGLYDDALFAAQEARTIDPEDEAAWQVEGEVLLTLGRYDEARTRLATGLESLPISLRLRLLARDAALHAGRDDDAGRLLRELALWVQRRARGERDAAFFVALGEAALALGVEPRLVLENFLKRGREATPPVREAFLAIGQLALTKGDAALAARTFQEGLKTFPAEPELWVGLATAFRDGDRSQLLAAAAQALELNPQHPGARLLLAEHRIDSEDYAGAAEELDRVDAINPHHPSAHALRAVLAHLRGDEAAAGRARATALDRWSNNPAVDHLIGRKLAQKYRFTEGAAAQRRALEFDPTFTPARIQLAQDLLRLGRDDEGWALAATAHQTDAYDVTAYNLVELRDRMAAFTVLTSPHFRLRMGAAEAPVYGARALALLEEARTDLATRYGLTLSEPVTIDIFPNPKDFAVRTFGMPGQAGYLGVCFGSVVTINSPASARANWESVLWHEFAHVITLNLTRNRLPRWLSEGISVYEERRRDPAWGQLMSLGYYERIRDGRLQPISAMSSAFLQASDQEDVLFAYYQSALAVEFIVERHGFPALRRALEAIRDDVPVENALARHVAPLGELDAAFAAYAEARATTFAAGFDLTRPTNPLTEALAATNPQHYHTQLARARAAAAREAWEETRTLLTRLTDGRLYLPGADNAHRLLARACRALGDRDGERAALAAVAARESDALDAITRLLELTETPATTPAPADAALAMTIAGGGAVTAAPSGSGDAPAPPVAAPVEAGALVATAPAAAPSADAAERLRWAERWLAIDPLAPTPWRALLTAHEARADAIAALGVGEVLLHLDPPDRAAVHHRLARLLAPVDPALARRHVLSALEEAPRFRAAHALLATLPPGPGVAEAAETGAGPAPSSRSAAPAVSATP